MTPEQKYTAMVAAMIGPDDLARQGKPEPLGFEHTLQAMNELTWAELERKRKEERK